MANITFQRLVEIIKNNPIERVTLLSEVQAESMGICGQYRLYEDGFEAVSLKSSHEMKSKAFLYVDRHPKQSIRVDYLF